MKNIIKLFTLALMVVCVNTGFSQDTLHLDFGNTQVVPDKPMEDKLVAWGKTLNGKKQDIMIVAYYHKGEFKKFAEQRVEEMFLSVNRKVRNLVNIKSQEAQKGENYQRTRVDIIYYPEGQDAKSVADKKKAEEKAAKDAEKKKKEDEEKLAKESKDKEAKDKKGGSSTTASSGDKKPDKKAEEAEKKAQEQRNKERWAKYGARPTKASGQGELVKQTEVQQIKTAKIIIAEFGVKEIDDMMENAIKKFFTFNTNFVKMPYMEAKAEAKKDPDHVFIMFVTGVSSKSLPHDRDNKATPNWKEQFQYVSGGSFLILENAKGGVMIGSYIPSFEAGGVTEEIVAFGCTAMDYLLKTMDAKQMNNNIKFESAYKEHSAELKNKTLYIPEAWINPKFDKNEIKDLYSAPYEVVSYEKWRDAILNKEDVAYVIIAPRPIGGSYMYYHYLVDAKTGMVYGIHIPKGATINGTQVGKGNTGMIGKKNVENYNDVLKGEW